MTRGVEGFRSTRLRQAREARGLNQTSLARMVNLSPQSLSLYERGATAPSPESLEALSRSLGVPFSFFFEAEVDAQVAATFWRSMSAATKIARTACERQYEWIVEIVMYLQRFIRLPVFDVPANNYSTPSGISPEAIEVAAENCRRAWGLGAGPISNVVWLLENHGFIIARFAFEADTLDALSRWSHELERGVILLNADKGSSVRSRFDAAHELVHLVLHRRLDGAYVERPETWKQLETQAHRFAGAFLLPVTSFIDDFSAGSTIEHYLRLKEKWGCSLAMMFHRALDLGIIDDADYKRLAIVLGRRGWRQREPLDDAIPVEPPQMLSRSFQLLLDRGIRSASMIRQELLLSPIDVSTLVGLPLGQLSDRPPTGEIIELRASIDSPPLRQPGSVIPLRRGLSGDLPDKHTPEH